MYLTYIPHGAPQWCFYSYTSSHRPPWWCCLITSPVYPTDPPTRVLPIFITNSSPIYPQNPRKGVAHLPHPLDPHRGVAHLSHPYTQYSTVLKPVWNDRGISLSSNIQLMHSRVTSIFLYPHSRAPKKNTSHGNEFLPQDTTYLIQRPCYQRGSPCQDPQRKPLDIVKRCKLQWYGHVSRSSGLAKIILQGTVKGGRRQGRQRKRWEDNISEWTGLEFAKS